MKLDGKEEIKDVEVSAALAKAYLRIEVVGNIAEVNFNDGIRVVQGYKNARINI